MDLGTVAISASILVACTLPFAVMYKKKINKKHQLSDELQQLAASKNCKLTTTEIYGEFSIGLDEQAGYVCYVKKTENSQHAACIDLSEIKRCEIKTTHSPFDPKNPKDTEIDRLALVFYPKSKQDDPISLGFYDVDETFQLADELPLIEKWLALVSKLIK